MNPVKPQSSIWTFGLWLLGLQSAATVIVWTLLGGAGTPVVGGVCVILTAIVTWRLASRMQRNIAALSDGILRLKPGDLQAHVPVLSTGEFASLGESLNQMALQFNEQIDLLKARHSEQSVIQESMSTAMIALDLQEQVLSLNRAAERLLVIDSDSAKGKLLRDAVHEPELNRFVLQAMRGEKTTSAEFQLTGKSGVTVQALGEPLRSGNKAVGLLVLLNDVTRLRRLEALRSDFAANVSHELRTPITNIKGYVETMLEVGVGDAEQTAKFLGIIHRNTERLAQIIEDLLALARLEQPDLKGGLKRDITPVRHILTSVMAQFEAARAQREIQIEVQAPADLRANVNAQLIEQAMGNLLSNAIKYSPPRTKVIIKAGLTPTGDVELSVIDQGPGIAKEHLPRLFERFYRVDRARSREMGGTGLGLAIVKHIAIVHGGRVDVESTVGRGSTFRMTLPGLEPNRSEVLTGSEQNRNTASLRSS